MSENPGTDRPAVTRLDAGARSILFTLLLGAILLMSAVAAVLAVAQIVSAIQATEASVAVQLTEAGRTQAAGAVTGLPAGTTLTMSEEGYPMLLTAADQSLGMRLLTRAGSSLTLACLAISGVLAYLTLRSIRGGRPFDRANATRLRSIGLLVLTGGLVGQAVDGIGRFAVLETVGLSDAGSPIAVSMTVSLTWILVGICALALAEAFAHGRRLTEDLEGVI